MKVIALTEEDVLMVAGPNADGTAALDPVPYHLGGFILPLRVLDDPAHADVHDYLAPLPQVTYVPPPAGDDA